MSEDVRQRVERYVANNADAGVLDILGALTLSPEHRRLVKEVLSGEKAVSDGVADESPSTAKSETENSPTGLDFTAPESGVWSAELLARKQWMGHVEKRPFAPWADHDHPEADDEEDARWKWGLRENYVDGETIAMAEDDPRLDGRVFLQQADDPYAFVDGDDVRCPGTGEVHPEFVAILDQLGATYTDISTSGTGVHANYRGNLPEGPTQATFAIDDEPWGTNDDVPEVEIYAGKHVCVQTGQHVHGTPTEINEWDDDALRAILDEYNQLPTRSTVDSVREPFDTTENTPSATTSRETTTNIRDLFAAIQRLDARQVAADTIVHRWNDEASTSDGKRAFVPTWGPDANGTANVVDDRIWQDTGGGGYGGPVVMALIDCGALHPETASPRDAREELWFRGIKHLRDLGYDIPAYEPASNREWTAVLPNAPIERANQFGTWNWRANNDGLTIDTARERTQRAIGDAYQRGDRVLIEALPTMGKSYGSIAAAAETSSPVTVLTLRGHKEQYDQYRTWANEHGLSHYTLPSFTRDCLTAAGEHGEEWRERVLDLYRRGMTPQDLHKHAEEMFDHSLPCQCHEGQQCPYTAKWDFDPTEIDVLIGHYLHAHVPKVTMGRAVVVDEFDRSAYETTLDVGLEGAISAYLSNEPALPFTDHADLIEHRHEEKRRADAITRFLGADGTPTVERERLLPANDRAGRAETPLAVFTLLAGENLGNGWERATLGDGRIGLYDRENGRVHLLCPPDLRCASAVVGLDGTPTKEMWERSLGGRLNHRQVLTDAERREYIADTLELQLVRTTEFIKPYNREQYVRVEEDAALLSTIHERHEQKPALITSQTALETYETSELDVLRHVGQTGYFGNLLGSNAFKTTRLGAYIGSTHFGDEFIERWGAYANRAVERGDGKGTELSYGTFGDKLLRHMREHETLQGVMRFGRDGNGATIYVHTNTLPDWVPIAGEGRVLSTWSDGMKAVLAAARELETFRTADIVSHPAVSLGRRQVFSHLETLREQGELACETEGRGYTWYDDGLHRINEHGDIEIEPVALDALSAEEVRELARRTYYTWEFTNASIETEQEVVSAVGASNVEQPLTANGGDPPPE